jgi:hypothetical protein
MACVMGTHWHGRQLLGKLTLSRIGLSYMYLYLHLSIEMQDGKDVSMCSSLGTATVPEEDDDTHGTQPS